MSLAATALGEFALAWIQYSEPVFTSGFGFQPQRYMLAPCGNGRGDLLRFLFISAW